MLWSPLMTKNVSLKRSYSMVGPDWIYGVLGTIGAFIAGAQMPLFALGVSQALELVLSSMLSNISLWNHGRATHSSCQRNDVLCHFEERDWMLVEPSKNSFTRGQIAGIFYGICQFFIFSSYGLALWYGSVLMDKELAGFKSIMKSFMVLIVTALAMGETLALAPDLLKGNHMAASVFEILDRKTRVMGDVGEELKNVEGTIELRGVQFSYPSRPDASIFKDFDLKVRSGKSIALVGQSGSGKSSVLALILRFYDPTAGKVMIDGIDIKKLKVKSLRKHIGLVQQEPALFAASIYENILYGKEGSSEAEVIEAAKLANAHNFISSLPEGKIIERGTHSGLIENKDGAYFKLVRLQQQGGVEQDH
ncbi:hypothetical protein OIU84_004348 [Salix udensis]|uniref:ABC transporter domain-containing protein n=1 Tax=Salix udensis TaxID=889485 RepID=A0AAD6K3W6_9ROSI|nr:hypothetical protein OIU84_004348 [Salix udensis]